MLKRFNVHAPETIVLKAKLADVELPMAETNVIECNMYDEGIPDTIGVCVGQLKDNVYQSYFKNDDNATKLKTYLDFGLITSKNFTIMDNNDLKSITRYFFLYNVDDNPANRSTYTEDSCGDGMSLDGHYECEYEILLGAEDLTRRMVFKVKSKNVSMYDWISDLRDILEDLDEDTDDEERKQFFASEDDDAYYFSMFDSVGTSTEIELDVNEFLSMIVSIRQLSCEFIHD